jgi:serine/threonine protein kinase
VEGFDSADLLDGLFGEAGATPAPPPAPTSPPVAAKPAPAPPPPAPPPAPAAAKAARPATPEVDRMLAGVLGNVDKPTSRTATKFSIAAPVVPAPTDGGIDLLSLAADAFGAPAAPPPRPAPPAPAPPAATDASSFGPYVLLGKIAMGGMAEVFLAKRPGVEGFEKVLAIKRILPHLSDNQEFVSMFVDEAKMVSGLTHPNIVQIFELGKLEHSYFIAMEYVHGRDLRTIQKRAREKETPFPVGLAMLITARVAAALEFAHRKKDEKGQPLQIVHRDISPQNILISFEGDVKLTDFGIAKAAAKASTTDRGALRGKLLYMSPEQAWGKPVDRRSDVFSLGVVFYELLTGRKPWAAAQDVSVLEMVRKSAITPLRDVNPKVPPSLAAVAMKALERDHEHRYQDASEFLQDLERTLRNVPVTPADLARFMRQLFDDQERGEVEAQAVDAPAGAGPAVEVDTNPTGNQGPRDDEDHTAPSVPRDPAAIQRFLKNFGIK